MCPLLFIYLNKAPSSWCLLDKLVLRSQKSTNLVYFRLTLLPSCNQAANATTNNKMILNNLHILKEIITYYFRFKCLRGSKKLRSIMIILYNRFLTMKTHVAPKVQDRPSKSRFYNFGSYKPYDYNHRLSLWSRCTLDIPKTEITIL